jgi:hypothetical protein
MRIDLANGIHVAVRGAELVAPAKVNVGAGRGAAPVESHRLDARRHHAGTSSLGAGTYVYRVRRKS